MKKSLISLVAAAAGTVTTTGDTNISIGGFIQTFFDWANNQGFLANTANPQYTATNKPSSSAQTAFGSTANYTRLGLALDNKAEGIKGLIEGDFWGGGAGESTDGHGNFRLRHAYVVKEFCQEGCNYTPWLLVGRTYNAGLIPTSYSLNGPVGIVGGDGSGGKIPQIGFGVKFDLGGVKLNPQIIAEDLLSAFIPVALNSGTTVTNQFDSVRSTMPGLGVRLPIEFNTGLGAPAQFYAAVWNCLFIL